MEKKLVTQKLLYTIAAILTPIIGTVFTVFTAFEIGVANMTNVDKLPKDFDDQWAVKFKTDVAQAEFVQEGIVKLILLGVLFLTGVILLCVLTGRFNRERDEDGIIEGYQGIHLNWFDKLWTELQLAIFVFSLGGTIALVFPIVSLMPVWDVFPFYTPHFPNGYYWNMSNEFVVFACGLGAFICIELLILTLVSLVKKLKAHCFIERSLLGFIVDKLMEIMVAASLDENDYRRRTVKVKWILGLAILIIIFICAAFPWVGIIVSAIAIIKFVPNLVDKYTEICRGVEEVKSGNLSYRIPVEYNKKGPKSELDMLAADINQISQATNVVVQNEIKNQKLKTDLISNVSHDLKTPLTSMLSYVDILKKEGLDSPKAEEYLDIIQDKTEKLKNLTEDLFEAAKASSGSVPCEITSIDLNGLIEQELAELNDILEKSELEIIKTCKVEATAVLADGRLLSRVIENVLVNASKYALENSRVYIDINELSSSSDKLLLEIKNISRERLNITPEELMERFTRGDAARNTEGSGLGLAIAKDLTNLMNGVFEIKIDGDMFKVSIILRRDK